MNILSIYHYAQNVFIKIIEPFISKIIAQTIIDNKKEVNIKLENEMNELINSCEDQDLIDEIYYSHMEIVKNKETLKIYFDYIFKLVNDFCQKNKIIFDYQLDNNCFNFKW